MSKFSINRIIQNWIYRTLSKPESPVMKNFEKLEGILNHISAKQYENQYFLVQYIGDKCSELECRIDDNVVAANICNQYLQKYYGKDNCTPVTDHYVSYVYDALSGIVNLGDYIQTIATEKAIKKCMGKDDIAFEPVLRSRLVDHRGGTCVMQGWYEHKHLTFLPGPDTRPVWIGTHFNDVARKLLQSLYKCSPIRFDDIGCRDKSTLNFCQSVGISAYYSRCLTLTLPRRSKEIEKKADKVYIVDCTEEMVSFLPNNIRQNAKILSQRNYNLSYQEGIKECRCKAELLLEEYKKNAKLVITTALHCAQPCLAMGIPVVFLDPSYNEEERFSSMEGLIPLYSLEDLKNNKVVYPDEAPDFELLKDALLKNLKLTLQQNLSASELQERKEIRDYIASFTIQY